MAVVHHVNCATLRPLGTIGGRLAPKRIVSHVLLVERAAGLLLVDSGFGSGDVADPGRLGTAFRLALRPALDPRETALAQVRMLGHDPADVRDIVLTHLDVDHAGGLADFPQATVHVYAAELDAATHPRSAIERMRYIEEQWAHGPRWQPYDVAGDEWLGLRSVAVFDDDVVLVPLSGHTRGHCGVAVRTTTGGWLLHAGDSYFDAREADTPPRCLPGLRAFQRVMSMDEKARRANQQRVRELRATHRGEVDVFCAHDPHDLERFAG